jgi:hypothetical protein
MNKLITVFLIFGLLAGMCGCSSLQKHLSATADRHLLFPPGVYTHQVEIETAAQKKYSFRGIVKISADRVTVIGLSPFQTTVFKIDENRKTKEIKADLYEDTLERHRDSLLEFYSTLSAFLTLPKNGVDPRVKIVARDSQGKLKEIEVTLRGQPTRVRIDHYDTNEIAEQFEIMHPKFNVVVTVVGYEG